MTKLPLRWQVLIKEYLIDFDSTQAAIWAGYSAKSARQIGTEKLPKPSISAAIAQASARRTEISADKALANVWAIATAAPRELSQVKVDACRCCHGEGHQRQRTLGVVPASGGRSGQRQGFARLDLMVSPSLENPIKP